MAKSVKWRKWRLSKYLFPTYTIKGSGGSTKGENVPGRKAAAAHLSQTLGRERVDRMTVTDTPTEWVFMEPIGAAQ